jgi:hypothetical protein
VQWLKLEHHCEFRCPLNLVFNDVTGDFRRRREWKTHMMLTNRFGRRQRNDVRRGRIGGHLSDTREEESRRRDVVGAIEAATSNTGRDHNRRRSQPEHLPIEFHSNSMGRVEYARNT